VVDAPSDNLLRVRKALAHDPCRSADFEHGRHDAIESPEGLTLQLAAADKSAILARRDEETGVYKRHVRLKRAPSPLTGGPLTHPACRRADGASEPIATTPPPPL